MESEATLKEKALSLPTESLGRLLSFFVERSQDISEVPVETALKLEKLGLISPKDGRWVMPKNAITWTDYWDLRDAYDQRQERDVVQRMRKERLNL